MMKVINKKLIVDEQGQAVEVIIPWKEYQEIEALLGFDLEAETQESLRLARQDREQSHLDAYLDI